VTVVKAMPIAKIVLKAVLFSNSVTTGRIGGPTFVIGREDGCGKDRTDCTTKVAEHSDIFTRP